MIYFLAGIIFLGQFLVFTTFFQAYAKEVGKAEQHVGFKIPGIIHGMLKTTVGFSFVSAGLATMYLIYMVLFETQLLF